MPVFMVASVPKTIRFIVTLSSLWLVPFLGKAQTDEIQVYTGEIAAPGEVTLTLHNNYTLQGAKMAEYAGGIIPNHSLNGVPELALGMSRCLELGLYLPVYTVTADHHIFSESAKLRALLAVPDAAKKPFFYAVNFELSRNARRWERSRISGEIRPIVGWRKGSMDFIINPILDTAFDRVGKLDFTPATRVARRFGELWAVAAEAYADFGPVDHFKSRAERQESLFAVVDYNGKTGVEFGIGHGLNGATDKWVIKLMISPTLRRAPAL
jgi:hypothetical protein